MFLLDTDICIKLFRGSANVVGNLALAGEEYCFISAVTLAELRYGAEYSQRPDFHHRQIDDFQLIVRPVPILEAIPKYAAEKARLRRIGLLIPDFDLLIGATAVTHGMILVTNNVEHLSRLADIRIDDWLTSPPSTRIR